MSGTNQVFRQNFQGPGAGNKIFNEYERLQEKIEALAGVKCTVMICEENVSIRCSEYVDFLLAKKAISRSVSLPIVWSRPI